MKLYFAPLEGITKYAYRNTHKEMFEGCDAYYAPFINPSDQEKVSKKGIKDILPENNKDISIKVQVLTNRADSFLKFEDKVRPMGYDEINVNLGCPVTMVTKKGRGSGFLCDPNGMDAFFDEVFSNTKVKISAKTRIGFSSPDEMENLMKVYNKYPLSLLIIHPRTREEFYKGNVHTDVFEKCFDNSKIPLCFNGNVNSKEDFEKIEKAFPGLDSVMFGRGAIQNPAIFREIKGGVLLSTGELVEFSKRLCKNYMTVLESETFTLHKLKEIWVYMMLNFPNEKKIGKAINKSKTIDEFVSAIEALPEL